MRRWLLRMILTPTERRAIRTLYECGCCCGVITLADGKRWDEAQKVVPELLDVLFDDYEVPT